MKNNLEVYNILREFHNDLKPLLYLDMTDDKKSAIKAVNAILYLAEHFFAKDGKLTDEKM